MRKLSFFIHLSLKTHSGIRADPVEARRLVSRTRPIYDFGIQHEIAGSISPLNRTRRLCPPAGPKELSNENTHGSHIA
jgi:hypothetical protein